MTKQEAQRQLFIGYIVAGIGLILGFILPNSRQALAPLLLAYTLWAAYWGIKIMYPLVKSYFNVSINSSDLWEAIAQRRTKMFWILGTSLILGLIVGIFGGGIYKQIRLMSI